MLRSPSAFHRPVTPVWSAWQARSSTSSQLYPTSPQAGFASGGDPQNALNLHERNSPDKWQGAQPQAPFSIAAEQSERQVDPSGKSTGNSDWGPPSPSPSPPSPPKRTLSSPSTLELSLREFHTPFTGDGVHQHPSVVRSTHTPAVRSPLGSPAALQLSPSGSARSLPRRRDTGKEVPRYAWRSGNPGPLASNDRREPVRRPTATWVYSVASRHPWLPGSPTMVARSTFGTRSVSPSSDDDDDNDDTRKLEKYRGAYDLNDEALASTIQEALVQLGLASPPPASGVRADGAGQTSPSDHSLHIMPFTPRSSMEHGPDGMDES